MEHPIILPSVSADRQHKLARLVAVMDRHGLESIQLSRAENLSWYFDGARATVPYGGAPVFSAIVHRDGRAVVRVPTNELERIAAEEVAGADFERCEWFETVVLPSSPGHSDVELEEDLREARASLLPAELGRYRSLAEDTAQAMTAALSRATPAMSEFDLAAAIAAEVTARAADVSVLLVAGAERSHLQHPLPTHRRLGDRAMGVVTARRHGMYVSLTRWVSFSGRADDATTKSLREVEAQIFDATRAGRRLGDVVNDIAQAYRHFGLGTPEDPAWTRHHQGGPTGYLGRDPKAMPDATLRLQAGGAFAWNPWVPGAKLEDTVLLGADGIEILSVDPAWPSTTVQGRKRPLTLDLS